MQQGRHTTQGGSIAVFAIVAVLLSAALVTAVFVVQKRGYQVRINQPIMEVADNSSDQPAEQSQQAPQQTDAEKQAADQRAAEQKAADDKKKAEAEQKRVEAEKQAAAEVERQRQVQAQVQQQAAAAPAEVPHTGAAPQALPTTGPADNLMQLIAGVIMVALVAAYLKSYRHRFGSLLK